MYSRRKAQPRIPGTGSLTQKVYEHKRQAIQSKSDATLIEKFEDLCYVDILKRVKSQRDLKSLGKNSQDKKNAHTGNFLSPKNLEFSAVAVISTCDNGKTQ